MTAAHTPLAPFTPGPLHVTRELDPEGYARHSVRMATGSPLAFCENYNAHEQLANATLYAAAPELLEALQAIVEEYAGLSDLWSRRARAAIAKATGAAS